MTTVLTALHTQTLLMSHSLPEMSLINQTANCRVLAPS